MILNLKLKGLGDICCGRQAAAAPAVPDKLLACGAVCTAEQVCPLAVTTNTQQIRLLNLGSRESLRLSFVLPMPREGLLPPPPLVPHTFFRPSTLQLRSQLDCHLSSEQGHLLDASSQKSPEIAVHTRET